MAWRGAGEVDQRVTCGWFLYPWILPASTAWHSSASIQQPPRPLRSKSVGERLHRRIVVVVVVKSVVGLGVEWSVREKEAPPCLDALDYAPPGLVCIG